MSIEELVEVEDDIFRTTALTGKTHANLEALENEVQKTSNTLDKVHNQFLKEQADLTELVKNREEMSQPQVLKKKIATAAHKLKELQRKAEHLTYIQQVENFQQDLVVLINKVDLQKKKLETLVQESNEAKALRKTEEQKTKFLRDERNKLDGQFKKLQETVKRARNQLKKLEKKKEEYLAFCTRYEGKVLKHATDLHKIENHLRKIDKSIGHDRTILRND